MSINYTAGCHKLREAYFKWRATVPWIRHSVASFAAGYNAALEDMNTPKSRKQNIEQFSTHSDEELVECYKAKYLRQYGHGVPVRVENGKFFIRSASGIDRIKFIEFLRRHKV